LEEELADIGLTQGATIEFMPKLQTPEELAALARELRLAVGREHLGEVKDLIAGGADPNLAGRITGCPEELPLYAAARVGSLEIVKYLLYAGADIDKKTKDGTTALHTAALWGHESVVQYLCEAGAKLDLRDSDGRMPLHKAAVAGHPGIAEILCRHGSPIDECDSCVSLCSAEGRTPLELARYELGLGWSGDDAKRFQATVEVLKDAFYTIPDAANTEWDPQQTLTTNRDKVDTKDRQDRTPLHIAAAQGKVEVVRMLLERKAAVDAKDSYGNLPLHLAVRRGHSDVVRVLCEAHKKLGVTLDATNKQLGSAALHVATEYGHCEILAVLCDSGAVVNTQDSKGRTCMDIALLAPWFKKDDLLRILKAFGGKHSEELVEVDSPL